LRPSRSENLYLHRAEIVPQSKQENNTSKLKSDESSLEKELEKNGHRNATITYLKVNKSSIWS